MDELAGYQRANLFGASNNIRTINDLPQEYRSLPNGPTSVSTHAEIQRTLNSNSSQALKNATFNNYARILRQAFRVNGTTYDGSN